MANQPLYHQLSEGYRIVSKIQQNNQAISDLQSKIRPKLKVPKINGTGIKTMLILAVLLFLVLAYEIYAPMKAYETDHADWERLVKAEFEFAKLLADTDEEAWQIAYYSHPEPFNEYAMFGYEPSYGTMVAVIAGLIAIAVIILLIFYALIRKRLEKLLLSKANAQRSEENATIEGQIHGIEVENAQLTKLYHRTGLPTQYSEPQALGTMLGYVESARAHTLQDAVNLYEQDKHNQQMRAAQQRHYEQMREGQRQISRQLDKQHRDQQWSDFHTRQTIRDTYYR